MDNSFLKLGLTTRETEVLLHLVQGKTNKVIANDMFISEKTVKFHLSKVYRRLGCKNRTELIVFCHDKSDLAQEIAAMNAITKKISPSVETVQSLPGGIGVSATIVE